MENNAAFKARNRTLNGGADLPNPLGYAANTVSVMPRSGSASWSHPTLKLQPKRPPYVKGAVSEADWGVEMLGTV